MTSARRRVTDDYGLLMMYRRCPQCQSWKPEAIGFFSPRKRDERRRVIKWDPWCLICRRVERRQWYASRTPEQRREMFRKKWEATKNDPERLARRRAENAEFMAKRRTDEKFAERMRAAHRAYYRRVKADPKKYAAYLERERINYRLRQERNGRSLDEIRQISASIYAIEPPMSTLPAAPLAAAINRRLDALETRSTRNGEGAMEAFLRNIGIEPRSFRGWCTGERQSVQFNVADVALTNLSLCWWDVWPPDEFPQVADLFESDAA